MGYGIAYVAEPAEGFVYVMECAGFHKIGWAKTSPKRRRSALQVSNPLPVTLVGVIEGSKLVEAEWHLAFREKRVSGEWFALTEEDVARVLHDNTGIDRVPGDDEVC